MANFAEFSDVVALGDPVTGVLTGLGNVRVTVVDIASGLNASIFSDRAGSTPITNPIVTSIGGKVQFFALDSKRYRLDVHDLEGVARIGDQSVYWDTNILFDDLPTITTPARSLDTTYQPNTTRPVLVTASITFDDTSAAEVRLLIEDANPPTVIRAYVAPLTSGATNVGLSMTGMVPAGWRYRLATDTGEASVVAMTVTEAVL